MAVIKNKKLELVFKTICMVLSPVLKKEKQVFFSHHFYLW